MKPPPSRRSRGPRPPGRRSGYGNLAGHRVCIGGSVHVPQLTEQADAQPSRLQRGAGARAGVRAGHRHAGDGSRRLRPTQPERPPSAIRCRSEHRVHLGRQSRASIPSARRAAVSCGVSVLICSTGTPGASAAASACAVQFDGEVGVTPAEHGQSAKRGAHRRGARPAASSSLSATTSGWYVRRGGGDLAHRVDRVQQRRRRDPCGAGQAAGGHSLVLPARLNWGPSPTPT